MANYGTEKIFKEIIISDTKKLVVSTTTLYDKKFLQMKMMWKKQEESNEEWKYSKKIISLNYESAQELMGFFCDDEGRNNITIEMGKR